MLGYDKSMERGGYLTPQVQCAELTPPLNVLGEARNAYIGVRQQTLARNFCDRVEAYLAGVNDDGVTLRLHQPGVIGEIRDFFSETSKDIGRSIMMPLPPNAGKSMMSVLIAKMAGIRESVQEGQPPLRALAMVPRRYARDQIIQACHAHIPGLSVRGFQRRHGLENFEATDFLIMTYRACLGLTEEEWQYATNWTDLLILDEAHRALGQETVPRIRHLMDVGRPTTLAMSATPKYNDGKTVQRVLGIDRAITRITSRDAVEMGISNGMQLFALYTGETIHFTSKRDTITDEDLQGFIDASGRNELILKTMEDMTKLGRQGLVQCLPGDDGRHAQMIARAACERSIIDRKTGQLRKMRVAPVGKFRKDNEEVIKAFVRRELDALTFSRYLIEAFDHPVRYLIAAAPTTSMVNMEQFVGRGARLGVDGVTAFFQLIDKYHSRATKRLQTVFDILGESCIKQGATVGRITTSQMTPVRHATTKGGGSTQQFRGPHNDYIVQEALSPEVMQAIEGIPSGTILEETLLVCSAFETPPVGYVPLVDLPSIKEGIITAEGAKYILSDRVNKDGKPFFVNVRAGRYRQYVLPDEAERFLAKRYAKSGGLVARLEINNFFVTHGWPQPSFETFSRECDAIGVKPTILKGTVYLQHDAAKKLLYNMTATPFMDAAKEIPISTIAQLLGQKSTSDLLRLARKYTVDAPDTLYKRRAGAGTKAYQPIEAMAVEDVPAFLEYMMCQSPKYRALLEAMHIPQSLADAQKNTKDAIWKRKIRSRIAHEAVDVFLSAAEAVPSAEFLEENAPLPEAYLLSNYGAKWPDHAACRDADVDIFLDSGPAARRKAKKLCDECLVKADCLLSELNNPSSSFAAGFTPEERQNLPKEAVLQWILRVD